MKKLLAVLAPMLVAFAACASFEGSGSAQATMIPCFGAPADYVARFDTAVDGVTDGAVSYPEPRAFLETQSWLTPGGVEAGSQSEHLHVGMCYPYAETWMQPQMERSIDVVVRFHDVRDYNIIQMGGTFVYQGGSGRWIHLDGCAER